MMKRNLTFLFIIHFEPLFYLFLKFATHPETDLNRKVNNFMQQRTALQSFRYRWRKSLPFWLILPTIVVILIVQVYPAIYTGWLSLQEREPGGWLFVGTKNFERLFAAGIFPESIGHTVVFLVGYTLFTLNIRISYCTFVKTKCAFIRSLHYFIVYPMDYC